MSDPRVWWHGNVAEKDNSNLMLGRYALFANTASTLDVTSSFADYGQVKVPHSWLYGQIWGLHSALGFYGYLDYLPANTMYECYMPYSGSGNARTNDDGEPILLDQPGGPFASSEGPQYYPHGQYRLTMGTAMALTSPFALTALNASQPQPGHNQGGLTNPANGQSMNKSTYFQQYYYTDYQVNPAIFQQFDLDTANTTSLLTGGTVPPVAIPSQPAVYLRRPGHLAQRPHHHPALHQDQPLRQRLPRGVHQPAHRPDHPAGVGWLRHHPARRTPAAPA